MPLRDAFLNASASVVPRGPVPPTGVNDAAPVTRMPAPTGNAAFKPSGRVRVDTAPTGPVTRAGSPADRRRHRREARRDWRHGIVGLDFTRHDAEDFVARGLRDIHDWRR